MTLYSSWNEVTGGGMSNNLIRGGQLHAELQRQCSESGGTCTAIAGTFLDNEILFARRDWPHDGDSTPDRTYLESYAYAMGTWTQQPGATTPTRRTAASTDG